jgi:peptidoglycan hydrolase-like protein with peptidoglycan-binding domain
MIPAMPRNDPPAPDSTPAQRDPLTPDELQGAASPFAAPVPTEQDPAVASDDEQVQPVESTDADPAASASAPVDNLAVSPEPQAQQGDGAIAADDGTPVPSESYPTVEEQFLTGNIMAPESVPADEGASSELDESHPGFEYDPDAPVPEWDPIGVVVPGQNFGASHLVVRLLGRGDDGRYGNVEAAMVAQRQGEAGLEATGVVSGATWALLLPSPFGPHGGASRGPLRQLLGVGGFNTALDAALLAATPEGGLDAWVDANEVPEGADPTWAYLLGLAVNAYFERESASDTEPAPAEASAEE